MRRPVAQTGDGDSFQDWFDGLGLVTKVFLVSTLLSGAMLSFGMLKSMDLIFSWMMVWHKFQVWRLFTPFIFAGGFSFNFAIHTYVLYENCRRYEANPFNTGAGGSSADFVWMMFVCMGILILIAFYFDLMVLSEPILYVIMYIWSRRDPDAQLSMFGFRFKALYLPWVYIAIRLIMGGAITEPLIGIGVGHLYYFLIEVLPVTHGYNLIRTPRFCVDLVTYCTGRTPAGAVMGERAGFDGAPAAAAAAGPAPFSGRGYTLGRAPAAPVPETNIGGATPATDGAGAGGGDGLRHRTAAQQNQQQQQQGNASMGSYNWGRGRALGSD